jgi:2-dehydropantoate 2-reductase
VRSVRLGEFQVDVAAVARLTEPVDLLIVATKATGLAAALERVATAPRLVLPLLNGVDHLGVLRERWNDRVCAGVIRVESDRPEPGLIVQTSPFLRIDVAPETVETTAAAHLLRTAEIPTKVGPSEADVMWRKLVRLNALACTTTAFAEPIGAVRAHPRHRLALEGAVEETAAVARAEGADIGAAEVLQELAEVHAESTSSMARDVAAGHPPELDAIPGAVLRAAGRHGIPAPTVEGLVQRIRERLT